MRKLLVLGIVLLFVASVASAQLAEVKVGKGDLKIDAILQAGFDYSMEEDEATTYGYDEYIDWDGDGINDDTTFVPVYTTSGLNGQFTMNRARLLLSGTICPDRVKYFVQLEFRGSPAIKDYKMILLNYIPKTDIAIGRFLPNFTHYMPMHTGKLNTINYPLFLIDSRYNYAMWRQVGFQTTTTVENFAKWAFNVGVFNGMGVLSGPEANKDNFSDNNDAFDVFLRADFTKEIPASWIHFAAYAWMGNLLMKTDPDPYEACGDRATNLFGFFGEYQHEDMLTVKGEIVIGTEEQSEWEFVPAENKLKCVDCDDLKSMGFYAHAEYKVNPQWGILGRYDQFDPNTDLEDDAWTWITFGVNHYIDSWNAMIYLNYIAKLEQNDWGATEKIKNDVVLLQFQVAP